MDALIGSSGFVGGDLRRQHSFECEYNSRNVSGSAYRSFDLVVCAAAPGSMFEANRFPDRDKASIANLIQTLQGLRCQRFVLVSSIAVLENFGAGADESTNNFEHSSAYGKNRRALEEFCTQRFPNLLIVRLPALFGVGLRKNFLFDLLNPLPTFFSAERLASFSAQVPADLQKALRSSYKLNPELGMYEVDRNQIVESGVRTDLESHAFRLGFDATTFTSPRSTFQYYYLGNLWEDIRRTIKANLKIIHLAPEPVLAENVYRKITDRTFADNHAKVHHEKMATRHANLWGRDGKYIMPATEVVSGISDFVRAARGHS